MYPCITMAGTENDSPLSKDEVDEMFAFFYAVHNHTATEPSQCVFWWRYLTYNGEKLCRA